jgi:hypothetical protein
MQVVLSVHINGSSLDGLKQCAKDTKIRFAHFPRLYLKPAPLDPIILSEGFVQWNCAERKIPVT